MTMSQLFLELGPNKSNNLKTNPRSRSLRWVRSKGGWFPQTTAALHVPLYTCDILEALEQRWEIMRELPPGAGQVFWTFWRTSRGRRVQIGLVTCSLKALMDCEGAPEPPAWYKEGLDLYYRKLPTNFVPLSPTVWERL